ncbi:M4 family metallopeptidase, partial [Staphylococcus aureus]|uniref:M4 family metallopeptidase n=1 Tax=Staphylococcus aureus TaxID=1280 RepID=UPI001642A286
FSYLFPYFLHHHDFLIPQHLYTPPKHPHPLPTISNPQQFPQPPHIKHYLFTQKHNPPLHTNSPIPNKPPYNVIQPIA